MHQRFQRTTRTNTNKIAQICNVCQFRKTGHEYFCWWDKVTNIYIVSWPESQNSLFVRARKWVVCGKPSRTSTVLCTRTYFILTSAKEHVSSYLCKHWEFEHYFPIFHMFQYWIIWISQIFRFIKKTKHVFIVVVTVTVT